MKSKQVCSLIIALFLCAALLTGMAAEENSGMNRTIIGDGYYFRSLAVLHGQLYALGSGEANPDTRLYRINPDSGEVVLLNSDCSLVPQDEEIDQLYAGEDSLLCFSSSASQLFSITLNANRAEIAPIGMDIDLNGEYPEQTALMAPYFFVKAGNRLYRFHLETGEASSMDTGDIRALTPYGDGKVLVLKAEPGAEDWVKSLWIFDVAAQTEEKLAEPQGDGFEYTLAYDINTGIVYSTNASSIYAMKPDEQQLVSLVSIAKGDTWGLTLLPDGKAAVITDGNFLSIRSLTNETQEHQTLTILAPLARSSDYLGFYRQYPNINLVFAPVPYDLDTEMRFTTDMLTRGNDVDVYLLSDQNLLGQIKKKGFAADLSASGKIQRAIERMETPFRNAFTAGDTTYTIPQLLFVNVPVYNKSAFEKMGLTPPRTFLEYFELCEYYHRNLADKFPEYYFDPFENGFDLATVMAQIAGELERNNQPLNFDTPEILSLVSQMKKAANLPERQYEDNREWLFYTYYLPSLPKEWAHMILTLKEDHTPALAIGADDFSYLVVNPYSGNQDAAIKLLESSLDEENIGHKAVLYQDMNQAIENKDYPNQLAQREAMLNEYILQAQQAQGAEKSTLEQTVQDLTNNLLLFKDSGRWQVSQTEINAARQLALMVYLPAFNPIWMLAREYPDFFEEYHNNPNFDPAQFLKQLDAMVKTALQEQEQ